MAHSQCSTGGAVGCQPSSRLCPATHSTPSATRTGTGTRCSTPRTIRLHPIPQITCAYHIGHTSEKVHDSWITVNSSSTSTPPRTTWCHDHVRTPPWAAGGSPCSPADTPASRVNTGAQKWAAHRIQNSSGVTRSSAIGSDTPPVPALYSRAWSTTMSTITSPRSASIPSSRVRDGVPGPT